MIADEAIRLVEFIRENDEDRYEYLSSSIEELASGISDMKRMLELVLDELEKHGIDIKDRQEYKDDCLPFWNQKKEVHRMTFLSPYVLPVDQVVWGVEIHSIPHVIWKLIFWHLIQFWSAFVYLFSLFYSLLPVSATPVECGKPKWSIFHETGLIV